MDINEASAKFRANADTVFHPAMKILPLIVNNVLKHPTEAKFRCLNVTGRAFKAVNIPGGVDFLKALGWVEEQTDKGARLVFPESADLEMLQVGADHLNVIYDIRKQEQLAAYQKKYLADKKAEQAKKDAFQAKFKADRQEKASAPVCASKNVLLGARGDKVVFKPPANSGGCG